MRNIIFDYSYGFLKQSFWESSVQIMCFFFMENDLERVEFHFLF